MHVFHNDVAIVNQNVTYVVMAIHACCKWCVSNISSFFHKCVESVFILDVAYVSCICCQCFICILHLIAVAFQMFLDVLQVFI